ncbi:MAG: hypothetical protein AABW50_05475 [Nanoarchaeota archaeon]
MERITHINQVKNSQNAVDYLDARMSKNQVTHKGIFYTGKVYSESTGEEIPAYNSLIIGNEAYWLEDNLQIALNILAGESKENPNINNIREGALNLAKLLRETSEEAKSSVFQSEGRKQFEELISNYNIFKQSLGLK